MRRTGTAAGIRAGALGVATAAVLLAGSPSAQAAPVVQLSEDSGHTVGQSISVNLDGLPPNLPTVAVGQCKPQITLPTDCNLAGSRMGKADEKGMWQPNDGNRTIVLVASIGGVDCTAAPGACTVAVTSLTDPSNVLASVPLNFGAKETPTPTATVDADIAQDDDSDSNTGVIIGIAAAVVIVLAVAVALLVRRRGSAR